MALLRVRDLGVSFETGDGTVNAVNGVDLTVEAGQSLAVVGESGSGKSQIMFAIMGLLARNGTATGTVEFDGAELLGLGEAALNRVRSSQIAMIFQDPMTSLNPYMRIADQMTEVLTLHRGASRREALAESVRLLDAMDVPDARARIGMYPHEFSGGQCQRINIARALIAEPRLVICDEPVSALDVSVQAQIINLLGALKRDLDLALIFIAHDLGVVKHISDRIMVFYLGRVMECAAARDLVRGPRHPYTRALISAAPIPDPEAERRRRATVLKGDLPSPLAPPSGCVFRTRCPIARPSCAGESPALRDFGGGHFAACPFGDPAGEERVSA